MKRNLSKRVVCIKLIILIIIISVVTFSVGYKEEASVVLYGLLDDEEQTIAAFNYCYNKSFASQDGSMLVSIPNGWRTQTVNDGAFSTGVLIDTNGSGHIQLFSFRLAEEDKSTTPDSIIQQLDFMNQPGGHVSFSVISENSLTVDTIKGKTFEISGSDRNGRDIHGLVSVLVRNSKCYIMSCISSETDFDTIKDTFLEISDTLALY